MFKKYHQNKLKRTLEDMAAKEASQQVGAVTSNYEMQRLADLEQQVQAICNHLGIWLQKPMGYQVHEQKGGLGGALNQTSQKRV